MNGPNQVRADDITYIATAEGWLYVAVLINIWSRRIVGFAMSVNIDKQLVMDAFRDAEGQRRLRAGWCTTRTGARSTPAENRGRCWARRSGDRYEKQRKRLGQRALEERVRYDQDRTPSYGVVPDTRRGAGRVVQIYCLVQPPS